MTCSVTGPEHKLQQKHEPKSSEPSQVSFLLGCLRHLKLLLSLTCRKPCPQQLIGSCNPTPRGDGPRPTHISFNRLASKREKSDFSWTCYLRIISVWGSVVWLPEKNAQYLSNLLLMLITAHQHLDTHKQNQSDYKKEPKTFSYHKKTKNKYDYNMIKYIDISPTTCRQLHIKITDSITRVQEGGHKQSHTRNRIPHEQWNAYKFIFSLPPSPL